MARKLQGAGLRPRPPKTAQDAMASLMDAQAMKGRLIRDRIDSVTFDGLAPPLIEFMRAFRAEMERYKIPMVFHEGWRSVGRQHDLLAQGVTKAKGGESPHQYGLAVDYIHAARGWKLTPVEWAQIGAIGHEVSRKRKVPMEWGGDWKFYDPAHWQLKNWRNWQSIMDIHGFGEHHRPSIDEWPKIIAKAAPTLLGRTMFAPQAKQP